MCTKASVDASASSSNDPVDGGGSACSSKGVEGAASMDLTDDLPVVVPNDERIMNLFMKKE